MKNFYKKTAILVLILFPLSQNIFATADNVKNNYTYQLNSKNRIETNILIERIEEINKIDKKTLSKVDKKILRNEVKEIKAKLNTMSGGGIYISVGAIIIIIILLIILL